MAIPNAEETGGSGVSYLSVLSTIGIMKVAFWADKLSCALKMMRFYQRDGRRFPAANRAERVLVCVVPKPVFENKGNFYE